MTTTNESDLLRKISGLLKKAEGTDNENEATAFFEKAQELMVRYAIDEARVRAQERAANRPVEEPVVEDYMFASYAHHAEAKEILLAAVMKAQSVRSFPYSNRKNTNIERVMKAGLTGLYESYWTRLVGYKSDIEAAKLLYLSLVIQSQRFAQEDWRARYGKDAKHSSWADGNVGKFTWLSNHMEAFADRIATRFREIKEGIFDEVADSKALIFDKETNLNEWMYEHGILRRPAPPRYYCWLAETPDSPSWPRNVDGKPNKKHRARYCVKEVIEVNSHVHKDGSPHSFTYDTGPYRNSYYVAKGRAYSPEAKSAGRYAADRADIGLTRVHSGARQIKG